MKHHGECNIQVYEDLPLMLAAAARCVHSLKVESDVRFNSLSDHFSQSVISILLVLQSLIHAKWVGAKLQSDNILFIFMEVDS